MVVEGMTTTFFSVRGFTCSAAMMMFLLLGNTKTVLAGTWFTAVRMSWVEGFMVWPPEMMPSTPRSLKTEAMPSPAHTDTTPSSFSAGATWGCSSCWLMTFSVCCRRIFSIFTVTKEP